MLPSPCHQRAISNQPQQPQGHPGNKKGSKKIRSIRRTTTQIWTRSHHGKNHEIQEQDVLIKQEIANKERKQTSSVHAAFCKVERKQKNPSYLVMHALCVLIGDEWRR